MRTHNTQWQSAGQSLDFHTNLEQSLLGITFIQKYIWDLRFGCEKNSADNELLKSLQSAI